MEKSGNVVPVPADAYQNQQQYLQCCCHNTIAPTSQNSRKQINLDSNSSQSYEFDPVDRHETHLLKISASPGKGLIAALLQQEFEHSANVAVVLDEHDSAVKDAFNPSLLSPSEEGYDALSLITFDGDADLQHRCRFAT